MSGTDLIEKFLDVIILNEGFVEKEILLPGKTGRGDGYLSTVNFVTVTGTKKNGEKKILHLVVKTPNPSKNLRSVIPITELFEKEAYIYDQVAPAFKDLEKELNPNCELSNFVPTCYLANVKNEEECLILENLKFRSFHLYDRFKTLPFDYTKLVLEVYGKLHGFSLAMKHKKPEIFKKLTEKNNLNMWPYYVNKVGIFDYVYRYFDEVRNVWENIEEIKNYLTFTKNDARYIICGELHEENPEDHVILHCDGWTNNFMFKMGNFDIPTDICLLDWQLSALGSPIIDLSYFIYTCVDTNAYPDVKELLGIYYSSLNATLQLLGCDSTRIFSFDKLLKHWEKFSCYGLIISIFILRFTLSEGNESPDFSETAESGKDFKENFENFTLSGNRDYYHERSRDNFLHFIRNAKL